VKDGDSLFGIAGKLGVPDSKQADWTASVVTLNSLSSPDALSVGQVLKVPGTSGQSSTAATNSNVSTGPAANTPAQPAASTATGGTNTSIAPTANPVSSAACMVSSNPTCDYGSTDVLNIPSLNEGDSTRCGSDNIKAAINVYDVRADGAMGIPVADCDVVRQNFAAFPGYGGYPGSGGTTVLAGHVDYHPHYMAVFWNLKQIAIGADIQYYNKDGKWITYKVDSAKAINDPNYDWAGVAKAGDKEAIVLITCDGTFNPATHEYDNRFIVHATRSN